MGSVSINLDTAATAAKTLFTAPKNRRVKVTGIEVDNRGTDVLTLTFTDNFTTTAGNTNSATAVTPTVKVLSVGAASEKEWYDELKSIEILGVLKVESTINETNCDVTVLFD